MTIKRCDRCKQEDKEIEVCMLPDFDKNGGVIGNWTIYSRPFKYMDLCYNCKIELKQLLDDFLESEI